MIAVLAVACTEPGPEPAPARRAETDVAKVRCRTDGSTQVLTPTVQAQRDGVHIDVRIPPGTDLAFVVRGSGGRNAEDGPFVFPVPPGRMEVACLDDEQDAGADSLYHPMTVVDDLGVYVQTALGCEYEGVVVTHAGSTLGTDPVEAARGFLTGLRDSDELRRVGYVGRRSEASVAVFREGAPVAILELEAVDNGWGWIGFTGCPEAGISY